MTESIHNAENLLYLTVGHIIGILDDVRTTVDTSDFSDMIHSTSISEFNRKRIDHEYDETNMECFTDMLLIGDFQFLEVLGEAEEKYTLNNLEIDRAAELVEVVEREISKDPLKYTKENSFSRVFSRGVVQYAQAILSQDG